VQANPAHVGEAVGLLLGKRLVVILLVEPNRSLGRLEFLPRETPGAAPMAAGGSAGVGRVGW